MTFLINDGSELACLRGAEINPTHGTLDKGLKIIQTGPASGNTGNGEAFFNQIESTFTASRTGQGLDGDSGSAIINALHIGFRVGGEHYNVQSAAGLAVGLVSIAPDTSHGDKVAINSGIEIVHPSPGKLYGASSAVTVKSGGSSPQIIGHETDTFILGTGAVDARMGYNAWSGGTKQASVLDTAFCVSSRGGSVDGTPVAPWKTGLHFQSNGGTPALSGNGTAIELSYYGTIQHVINMPNVNITGAVIKTPNVDIYGSGQVRIAGNITFDYEDRLEYDRVNNGFNHVINGVSVLTSDFTSTHPGSDGTRNLGWAGARWAAVFSTTGTINTSDATAKTGMRDFTDAELDAWGEVRMGAYQFLDAVAVKGDAARVHFGRIAQEVGDAFLRHGIDPKTLALWCADRKTEKVMKTRTVSVPKMRTETREETSVEFVDGFPVKKSATVAYQVQETVLIGAVDDNGLPIMSMAPVVIGSDSNGKPIWLQDEDGRPVLRSVQETHPVPVMEDVEEEYEETVELDEFTYGLRTEYCAVIEAAYQRRRADRIESRLSSLERQNAFIRVLRATIALFR